MSTLAQTNAARSVNVEFISQPNCRGARESRSGLPYRGLVKRIAPMRVVSFFLWAACAAPSQSVRLSPVSTQGLHSYSAPDAQHQELHPTTSLPYAPSVD